jgi:acyl dehydratase
MAINRECIGKTYGPEEMLVEHAGITAYAEATADPLPVHRDGDGVAPPAFGIVPVWSLIQKALADEQLGVDPGRVVHGEQRMRFQRLIRAGDALTSTGRIATVAEQGANELMVISLETRDSTDELVTRQEVVCVSRGTASRAARSRSGASGERADADQRPDLVRSVPLPLEITHRYARASGDHNRIHIDDEFARAMGLPGVIVHGMCMFSIALQAVIEAVAGGRPERIGSASVRFRRPVQPGTALETRVYLTPEGARFDGRAADGDVALRGEAAVRGHVGSA